MGYHAFQELLSAAVDRAQGGASLLSTHRLAYCPSVLRASQHDPFERRLAGLPLRRVLLSTTVRKKLVVASITLARD